LYEESEEGKSLLYKESEEGKSLLYKEREKGKTTQSVTANPHM